MLNREQIESISCGAVNIVTNGKYTRLYRFTEEQIAMYAEYMEGCFSEKTHVSAGIKLAFNTDSKYLKIKGVSSFAGSRSYFAIDLVVDGEYKDSIANFIDNGKSDYFWRTFPLGEFEKTFELGCGVKKVEIYLPFAVTIDFEEISLDEGAFIEPVKAQYKGLLFGDSITQGYDCLYPSKHYAVKLSKFLDTDFVNKAIGGEMFNPRLAKLKDDIDPDYILIAYGTNDWTSGITLETLTNNCKDFCQSVRNNYPKAKMFIIAPIWRKDKDDRQVNFDFTMLAKAIKQVATEVENITFIDGYNFVPHSAEFFTDSYLHPNDMGFKHYAENLCKNLKEVL
ncbi:MAG: SGNH/GDSL hydrolase family protein [Clostridia bacterium]|nr:SGNH/GDSL hydrolase family protein [Clostridia bacterium]